MFHSDIYIPSLFSIRFVYYTYRIYRLVSIRIACNLLHESSNEPKNVGKTTCLALMKYIWIFSYYSTAQNYMDFPEEYAVPIKWNPKHVDNILSIKTRRILYMRIYMVSANINTYRNKLCTFLMITWAVCKYIYAVQRSFTTNVHWIKQSQIINDTRS